jgi:hypothetical protein
MRATPRPRLPLFLTTQGNSGQRNAQSGRVRCQAGPPFLIPFQNAGEKKGYSLRLYRPYPCVETRYINRPDGYLALGSYMSGANASGTRFPETQPIVMQYAYEQGDIPEEKTMRVYLHGSDDLPAPTDPSVRLGVGGGEIVAAIKFEGNATKEVCEKYYNFLIARLREDIGPSSVPDDDRLEFSLAQYGPLHSLTPRLNEILVRVQL